MTEEQRRAYYAMHGIDPEEYEDGEEQYEEEEDV